MPAMESRISSFVGISFFFSLVAEPARWLIRLSSAFVLFDQCIEGVDEVTRDGVEQVDELLRRGGHETGQLGQQLLTRRYVGEGFDVVGRQSASAEHTAFDDECFVVAGVLAQNLGDTDGIAGLVGHERAANAIAVGPSSRSSISIPRSRAAKRTNVFLYTLSSPPDSRRDSRSAAIWGTLSPRYSVSTAASALESFSRTSSTTATFSGLGFSITPPSGNEKRVPAVATSDRANTRNAEAVGREFTSSGGEIPIQPVGTGGLRRAIQL